MAEANGAMDFETFLEHARARTDEEFAGEDLRPNDLVIALNRATGIAMGMAEGQVHRPRGLNWNTFKMMYILWVVGDMGQHRVAALAGMSRATASAVVKGLVRQGHVVQVQSSVDKRTNVLALTDTGRDLTREAFLEQNSLLTGWSNRLTHTEQDMLKMLVYKLMRGRD